MPWLYITDTQSKRFSMLVSEFDYKLPENLIAQTPAENRENSRIMLLQVNDQSIQHKHLM